MPMSKDNQDWLAGKAGVNPPDLDTVVTGGLDVRDLYNSTIKKFVNGSKDAKSIIGMAAKNTCEFPVFVSNSVPLDYATAICALLEQNYASFIQQAISLNPIVDQKSIKNGGYLAQFKTNTAKYLEYTELISQHEACHNLLSEDGRVCEFDMLTISDRDAQYINEMCSYEPLSEFDHFFNEANHSVMDPPDNGDANDFAQTYVDAQKAKAKKENKDPNKKKLNRDDVAALNEIDAAAGRDRYNQYQSNAYAAGEASLNYTRAFRNFLSTGDPNMSEAQKKRFEKEVEELEARVDRLKNATKNQDEATLRKTYLDIQNGMVDLQQKLADVYDGKYQAQSDLVKENLRSVQRQNERLEKQMEKGGLDEQTLEKAISEKELTQERLRKARKDAQPGGYEDKQLELLSKQIEKETQTLKDAQEKAKNGGMNEMQLREVTEKWKKTSLENMKLAADIGGHDQSTAYGKEVYNRRAKLAAEAEKANYEMQKAAKELGSYDAQKQMAINKDARERMVKGPEMMDETKIKKLNTLKPMMMKVQIRVSNPNGSVTEYPIELVVGVKVFCRIIDAEILPEVAKFPVQEMDKLSRKVKWKAGELKFFKDFIFNIKEKKQTAIDSRDPKKRWYRRLYQLAHEKGDSHVAKAISGNDTRGLIPNASIVVTNSDVENVKSSTGIDLLKSSTAVKFCKELFLMSFVVVDQDAQSIKLLYPDTHNDFEVQSFAAVEKELAELSAASAKAREMFKLIG